jgi:hypothetical protein
VYEDLIRAGEESARRLAALTPEQNLAAARLARDVKPRLRSGRQREIA